MGKLIALGSLAVVGVVALAIGISLLLAYPTMWAWGWFVVPVFKMPALTFWQAFGLNILAGLFKSSNTNNCK